jgi:ABC-type amino acid transport substrate-binding protein
MRRILSIAAAFAGLCAVSTVARPLDKVRKDALTVGIRTDNPPFGYNETADRKGLEYDLVAAIADGMGIRFRVVKLASQHEGEDKLLADKVDLVIGSVKSTEDLRERFLVTGPYFRTGLGILVLKSNQSVYTLTDLNGRPVAATPESNADKLIDNFIPKAKLELVRTTPEGLSMLEKGDVDAFVHDRSILQAESARNSALRLLDVSLTEDNYAILVNKKSNQLLDALNAELDRMRTPPAGGGQSPLAALCARYKLGFTVKALPKSAAPGAGVAQAPATAPRSQSSSGTGSDDLERRLQNVERKLQEIQASLVEINTILRAPQK